MQLCLQCVGQIFPWIVLQNEFTIARGIANVNIVSLVVSSILCYTLFEHKTAYKLLVNTAKLLIDVFKCERVSSLFYSKYGKRYVFAGLIWGAVAQEVAQFMLVGMLSHHSTISFDFEERMIGNTVQYAIHYDSFLRLVVMSGVSCLCQRCSVSRWRCDFIVFTLELANHIMYLMTGIYLWELLSSSIILALVQRYDAAYY